MTELSILAQETYTDPELAAMFDVEESTIRKWRREGKLPPKLSMPGRIPRTPQKSIREMLQGEEIKPTKRGREKKD
jgi:transposase